MHEFITRIVKPLRRLAGEIQGQDMIEYALMAGLLVLAAAAIMPNLVLVFVNTVTYYGSRFGDVIC